KPLAPSPIPQPFGRGGVELAEPAVKLLPRKPVEIALQLATANRIVGRLAEDGMSERTEEESSSADEEWEATAGVDLHHALPGVTCEPARAEALVGVHQVEPVVRHRGALGGCRLGGADIHAAVHLPRVHADDLGVEL